jgi:hypothetical protein
MTASASAFARPISVRSPLEHASMDELGQRAAALWARAQ